MTNFALIYENAKNHSVVFCHCDSPFNDGF